MNYQRILVFGAHPDDEQTMAGTMAKMADMGVEVYVAIFTDGREGYPEPWMKDRIVEMRRAEGEAREYHEEYQLPVQRHHLTSFIVMASLGQLS